jgi:hypothetical protein
MMNPGDFRWQVDVLDFAKVGPHSYGWVVKRRIWAKMEQQAVGAMFSRYGVMARSVKFTVHRLPDLTLHNALASAPPEAGHFFLTDINREMPGFYVVSAASVEPVDCVVERTKTVKGDNNRPVTEKLPELRFPGHLVEKYIRQSQEEPMSYSETRFVLVAPKVIEIQVGELVYVEGVPYEMVIPHTLDPYKNEFEILRRADN